MASTSLCALCATPLGAAGETCGRCGARPVHYWVRVLCEFQCRGCGHWAPLNYLDLDGSVLCQHCGLEQVFSNSSWQEALEFAQAVGDLAGGPDGRWPHSVVSIGLDNPFAAVGSPKRPEAVHAQSGSITEDGLQIPKTLRIKAAPEHPRDPETGQPLTFQLLAPWELRSTAPASGRTRTYKAAKPNLPWVEPVAAIVSEEYRSDQLTANVGQSPTGVAILQCPSCGGTLRPEPGCRAIDCSFCHARCRIPERLRYVIRSPNVAAEPWWILFSGPSDLRKRLEAGEETDAGNGADKARKNAPKVVREASLIEEPSVTDRRLYWLMTIVVCAAAWLVSTFWAGSLVE
ncbi:MAG: hypothetical protein JW940_06865 [Polyangiaceae bacterium]|nr:hypothetical protein [Polyangiaceae bacterium]